jgi:hypothetical protein
MISDTAMATGRTRQLTSAGQTWCHLMDAAVILSVQVSPNPLLPPSPLSFVTAQRLATPPVTRHVQDQVGCGTAPYGKAADALVGFLP